ncbi:MAG: aryl-alcohol dehydrogenase-like predicted oxidoreductase [Gammaproteobacteria bacterium]|jgi:aryl-alcohol dehydrogenase-like predicted oxidoreductase
MKTRELGQGGPSISAVGLGCMVMSGDYGPAAEHDSIATLHRALDIGVNFLDTADIYGLGGNETLVGKALKGHRDACVLATKFGNEVRADGSRGLNAQPEYVPRACDASLKRLGVEFIDLYYLHRPDPQVDIVETVGAMAELVSAGKVRYLGLSEVSAESLRRAHAVHPIAALQSEYSLFSRDHEQTSVAACAELGITFVPYAPLGRALLSGAVTGHDSLVDGDKRHDFPRFNPENIDRNVDLLAPLREAAANAGCSVPQAALAWLLSRGDNIVPIPGTRRIAHLESNAAAADVALGTDDLQRLDDAFAPGTAAGERMNPGRLARAGR